MSLSLIALAWASPAAVAAGPDTYQYTINLASLKDDKLTVELAVPKMSESAAVFHMPKMVPGTYKIYDFGRFLSEFKAFDAAGTEIPVTHPDQNTWRIEPAAKLARITYRVEDTFDTELDNAIFEPAGSNFDVDSDFVLNTHCFFGYFDGHKAQPYEINIRKPQFLYGSTALEDQNPANDQDKFNVSSYMELTDSPIMYARPDTAWVQVGSAKVLVSVYSHGEKKAAKAIAQKVNDVMIAAKNYLGGDLPVKKYAFIIYTLNKNPISHSYGALEHSYSSFYSLPDASGEEMGPMVRQIAAHEFFHIVTPLSIHATEIGDFNYINPEMSEHLWLYEGVTEYTSHYVQLREGLTDLKEFLHEMQDKIETSRTRYNDTLAFTKMSKLVLTKEYEPQYGNVYQKGALIGLCLDVKLRSLSNGKTGLKDVITGLSKKYGKDRSFRDEDLFNDIQALSYPEIGNFLRTYVSGNTPLPFEEVFGLIGVKFANEQDAKDFTLGKISLGPDEETGHIKITDISQMNDVGKKLGYKEGDVIMSINGIDLPMTKFSAGIAEWKQTAKEGDKMVVVVQRLKGKKIKTKKLKAKATLVSVKQRYVLEEDPKANAAQLNVRKAWMGK
ncbi:MAG: peptidase M61 [Bacteroidota bacterium]